MKKIFFLSLTICCIMFSYCFGQDESIKTYNTGDWSHWTVKGGKIKTYNKDEWKYWEYSIDDQTGKVKTFSSTWDSWEVNEGNLKLKTLKPGEFDHWEISGGDTYIRVRPYASESISFLEVYGDVEVRIKLHGDNWNHWEVFGDDLSTLPPETRAAVYFIPIFISSLLDKD